VTDAILWDRDKGLAAMLLGPDSVKDIGGELSDVGPAALLPGGPRKCESVLAAANG
jgi:hypothetical protein